MHINQLLIVKASLYIDIMFEIHITWRTKINSGHHAAEGEGGPW